MYLRSIRRGQTHFAYVDTTFPTERERSEWRFDIYRRLLGAEGRTLARYPSSRSRDEFANLRHLADWLTSLPKPCMVFAYADNRAPAVIDACHLAHLSIPDQVSVIGIDNDPEICEMVQPTLTSVYPDFERSGYLAAQALHRILRAGKRPRKPIVYHYGVKTIVERGSTQDLRGGGRLVSQAQQIIAESLADPPMPKSNVCASRRPRPFSVRATERSLKSSVPAVTPTRTRSATPSRPRPASRQATGESPEPGQPDAVRIRERLDVLIDKPFGLNAGQGTASPNVTRSV